MLQLEFAAIAWSITIFDILSKKSNNFRLTEVYPLTIFFFFKYLEEKQTSILFPFFIIIKVISISS